ncbi:hypothetical protein FKP32DRAFT_1606819 [Trametes sanguinea]|nr:hypothetical protein FKP32DRAFT_1606819 [Trametes sanguinea]
MDSAELHSTPIAGRRFITHNWATTPGDCSLTFEFHHGLVQYRAAAVEDMAHKAVPLDPEEFLEHVLNGPAHSSENPWAWELQVNPFEELRNAASMKESQISELFVKAVNHHNLAPGLSMALSEDRPEKGDSKQLKIDSAFYRADVVPTDGRPHWADQIVSVEFKAHGTANDPYDDRVFGAADAHAETRKQVRGQIIHYAEQVFEYQHRTALIFLIIIGRRFRFSRWDRSGTLVTRSVDYVEHPEVLCEMLWYMSRLSDEGLGMDTTAHRVMPGSEEYTQMIQAKCAPVGMPDIDHTENELGDLPPTNAVFRYVREMFAQSLDETFPWYRLDVPHDGGVRSFLVGKPVFCAPGMAGRGTKGFVALVVAEPVARFVWLKDAWRTQYQFVAQEGAVLKELNDAGVSNVPNLICHGDIPGQETETPRWWELKNSRATTEIAVPPTISPPGSIASSSRTLVNPQPIFPASTKRSSSQMNDDKNGREDCPLRRHKHYRLVVKEVGMKLVNFQDGQQLLQIIYDCVFAHKEAVVKANIMHRDISGGNILILPQAVVDDGDGSISMRWTGLLVDWELSKPLKGEAGLSRPRQPERTGTWQFMSAAVLNNHSKKLEISDELESFFHVTLYYAIRYLRSNCSDVGAFIENYFDTYTVDNGTYRCGDKKSNTLTTGSLATNIGTVALQFGSDLDLFFSKVLQWFKAHYATQQDGTKQASKPRPVKKGRKPIRREEHKAIIPPAKEPVTRPNPEPFTSLVEDAAKITTHRAMLDALMEMLEREEWPLDRAEGDNVPIDFKPKIPVGPPPCASEATMKRRRLDIHTCGPEFPFRGDSSSGLQTPRQRGVTR